MAKKYLHSIVLLLFCYCIKAQGKIDTDRPDQTESAFTVPRNYIQAEIGFNKENTSYDNYDLVHPTLLLKYGLKKLEFRLEITSRSSYEKLIPDPTWTRGFEPVEIGFKAALWEQKKWIPKTSLIAGTGLSTIASKNFRTDHLAPFFRFTMQNSLTSSIALGYNLGAEWDGFSSTPAWLYTFAPGFELGEKWYAYIEAFGFIRKDEHPEHSLDAGLAWYINNNNKIDISGGIGISKAAPKNYIAVGISFRVNTKHHSISDRH
jgi:Putative MetA-pathway of phenol degradation